MNLKQIYSNQDLRKMDDLFPSTGSGNESHSTSPEPAEGKVRKSYNISRILIACIVIIGIIGFIYLSYKHSSKKVEIAVPRTHVSAYSIIRSSDLTTTTIDVSMIPKTVIQSSSELIGKVTATNLQPNQPISYDQIIAISNTALLSNTFIISIAGTSTTLFGGTVQSGDIVDILLSPTQITSNTSTIIFENIMVIDSKPVDLRTNKELDTNSLMLVLALPKKYQGQYAIHIGTSIVIITKKITP